VVCVIVGETLFNASYPSEPPDFIFTGNDQQFQPDIAEVEVATTKCLQICKCNEVLFFLTYSLSHSQRVLRTLQHSGALYMVT